MESTVCFPSGSKRRAYPAALLLSGANDPAALDAFLKGNWESTHQLLHSLPAEDRGTDFLNAFILQHNHTPPPGWDGVIPMTSKS